MHRDETINFYIWKEFQFTRWKLEETYQESLRTEIEMMNEVLFIFRSTIWIANVLFRTT